MTVSMLEFAGREMFKEERSIESFISRELAIVARDWRIYADSAYT